MIFYTQLSTHPQFSKPTHCFIPTLVLPMDCSHGSLPRLSPTDGFCFPMSLSHGFYPRVLLIPWFLSYPWFSPMVITHGFADPTDFTHGFDSNMCLAVESCRNPWFYPMDFETPMLLSHGFYPPTDWTTDSSHPRI